MDETGYPERRSGADIAHSIVQAGVGAVPVLGSLLTEIIEVSWQPRLERRRAEWLSSLGARLESLAQEVTDVRDRVESDEFLEVFIEAARAAQATHEEEKRDALRNAVINTALEVEESQAWRLIFVNRLADLQPAHLHLLSFLADPRGGLEERGITPPDIYAGGRSSLVELAVPTWGRPFYDQLYGDLARMSLTGGAGLHTTMTGAGVYQSELTEQGRRFLAFISET